MVGTDLAPMIRKIICSFIKLQIYEYITAFGRGPKVLICWRVPRFGNNFATTIYGIASIFEKVLRFLSVLLTFQKL